MRKLLIPLLVALAFPTAVNAFPWNKKNKDSFPPFIPSSTCAFSSGEIYCREHNVTIYLDESGRPIRYFHEGESVNLVKCYWYGGNEFCTGRYGEEYVRKN